ncbi:hypothetical protein MAR_009107 [Mya arenaria]|uniref:Phospholipase A2-like domain-containing protein n=1 Tax=Mya arenaria TaxID=6604 RepID=A0ABY7E027_MYAAR|nr:hypothetical protein MAR_009107 [Mya arenaria]
MKRGKCVECGSTKTQFVKGAAAPHKSSHSGSGVMNNLINKLPFEMHLPDHNFTGPGTNLNNRLNKDMTPKPRSVPINRVDNAAYHHDVCYAKNKDTGTRNRVCDKNMIEEMDVIYNPSLRERPDVVRLISANRMTKIKVMLNCRMERTSILTGDVISEPASFHSHIEVNLEGIDVSDLYTTMTDRIMEAISNFQRQGSNWVFKEIISLEIHTGKYQPLRGNSYIPFPNKLESKKAIINMKNEDDMCFTWCVLQALNPVDKNSERIDKSLKGHKDLLNMNGIEYPVTIKAIDRFERQNATISVNVFGYENKDVYPLRISKYEHNTCVNLLLIDDGEKQHYCLIKSMSRLLSAEWRKNGHKRHYCYRCLNSFNSEESLGKHKEYCDSNDAVKIEMLEEGSTLNFKHFFKSMRVPFIVYADFESFTQKLDTAQPNLDESYTKQYQKHTPSGFCYYIKCFDDGVDKIINLKQNPIIYTKQTEDDDVSQIFVDSLEQSIKDIYTKCGRAKMIISKKQQRDFEKETVCWICQGDSGEDRVRDHCHCHFSGKYQGAVHNDCNLKYRKPKFTPVVFHNLSGQIRGNINCIPNNEEKYISFTKQYVIDSFTNKKGEEKEVKHELRFIDSFKFMASSLDKLVGNLQKDQFGVYPNDYVDGLEKLAETQLPPKEEFYSKLSGDNISDEDYVVQKVWKEFECKTMRDYHNLYLTSDVLLLADVFETFRDVCLTNYNLDPAWYYTAPGLAWDAALKLTEVELELISDPDMLLMIE